jgi:hypothetical protein
MERSEESLNVRRAAAFMEMVVDVKINICHSFPLWLYYG